jgi:TBC1 domain family member 5
MQDVERCMPENLYFRQPDTQRMMLDILFVFCKLNPDISYRQGMHELLAPILWVIERDAIDLGPTSKAMGEDAIIKTVFDAEHIEHDSFALFGQVMQNAKNFYEHATTSGNDNPMVIRSQRICSELLPVVDTELAKHLESIDIIPQVFLMRWIRLLFGREFEFDDMLTIWDVIFAEDPTLEIVDHICIVMLLRIRWDLVAADYNSALTQLLKYREPEEELAPQEFVVDALHLRDNMNHHSGSHVVSKYTGRPLQIHNRPVTPPAYQRHTTTISGTGITFGMSRPLPTRMSSQARNIEAVLQSTAKNLYAQGEKLGIGKAVRTAVEEVHRKAQEIRETQTPASPGTWRPRSERSTLGAARLLSRLTALESRNKQIAKLLDDALSELWDYQSQLSAAQSGSGESEKTVDVEQLSTSIAKVQFVKVYLDDPSLPLPHDDSSKRSSLDLSAEGYSRQGSIDIRQNSDAATDFYNLEQGQTPTRNPREKSHNRAASTTSVPHSEQLADPSTFEDFTQTLEEVATKGIPPKINLPPQLADDLNVLAQTSSMPQQSNVRPSLEQSSFSWMLNKGNGSPPRRSLDKPPPLKSGQDRQKGFLFGESEAGQSTEKEEKRKNVRRPD